MFNIMGNVVFAVREFDTGRQVAKIQTFYGMLRRLVLSESAVSWQAFDLSKGEYVDANIAEPIALSVDGVVQVLVPDENGVANFVIDAPVGKYIVRTMNNLATNAELEVIIDA